MDHVTGRGEETAGGVVNRVKVAFCLLFPLTPTPPKRSQTLVDSGPPCRQVLEPDGSRTFLPTNAGVRAPAGLQGCPALKRPPASRSEKWVVGTRSRALKIWSNNRHIMRINKSMSNSLLPAAGKPRAD